MFLKLSFSSFEIKFLIKVYSYLGKVSAKSKNVTEADAKSAKSMFTALVKMMAHKELKKNLANKIFGYLH